MPRLRRWIYSFTVMHIPESAHLWVLFIGGHGLHVLKRASLSAGSPLSGTKTRIEWMRTNALGLVIRLFVNAAAFSYWLAHPAAATHAISSVGIAANFTLEPGHATARCSGCRATAWWIGRRRRCRFCKKKFRRSIRGRRSGEFGCSPRRSPVLITHSLSPRYLEFRNARPSAADRSR